MSVPRDDQAEREFQARQAARYREDPDAASLVLYCEYLDEIIDEGVSPAWRYCPFCGHDLKQTSV